MAVILGIESSCDETAAAVVVDGWRVLAERVASQAADFATWGGVVPELAARGHVDQLPGIALAVLAEAGLIPTDLEAVAVTARPGLIGSLLCGLTSAKVFAARLSVPLLAVDHVQAHIAAIRLGERGEDVAYPLVALVASGGHSHYYLCREPGRIEPLGGTIDDAAGEALDKAAATLELGYPGGPRIEVRAASGNPAALDLPRSFLRDDTVRLSFAGLKTSLLYRVRGPQGKDALRLDDVGLADACASFQGAVIDCLLAKLALAADRCDCRHVAITGGVANNGALRRAAAELAAARSWTLHLPAPVHCGDNAAMVAALGELMLRRGEVADLGVQASPTGSAPAPCGAIRGRCSHRS